MQQGENTEIGKGQTSSDQSIRITSQSSAKIYKIQEGWNNVQYFKTGKKITTNNVDYYIEQAIF